MPMPTILIADDNTDLRMLLRMMLSDYEVFEAENGSKAVEIYKNNKPDLVLMDILMPEKDGIEATKEIMEYDPEANIIAITAYHNQGENILEAGAKLVVKKPIRKQNLLKLVRENIS